MKAAILYEKGVVAVEDRPEPGDVAAGEVKIRVRQVGICGSDLKYFLYGGVSTPIMRPFVLGHEASGRVVAVGSDVQNVKVGERVAIEPGKPCWHCEFCRTGNYNLCPNMYFMASRSRDGALQEYLNWPAELVFPLPDTISDEEGALIEPLSVALSGVLQANVQPGKRVLVLGAGAIGLAAVQFAKLAGANFAAVTDTQPHRLAIADSVGSDLSINVTTLPGKQLPIPESSVDMVIETTGVVAAVAQAYPVIKPGGQLILIGLSQDHLPLSLLQIAYKQLSIHGIYRYKNTFPAVIDSLVSGKIQVKPMITHRFPLADALEAMRTAAQVDKAVKVMITL